MPCCGLCRAKKKPTHQSNKNLSNKKVNTIEMWIENIEGPYEPIVLPSKAPEKPNTITNKEEIGELQRDHQDSGPDAYARAARKREKRTLQNLPSEHSSNVDSQFELSVI